MGIGTRTLSYIPPTLQYNRTVEWKCKSKLPWHIENCAEKMWHWISKSMEMEMHEQARGQHNWPRVETLAWISHVLCRAALHRSYQTPSELWLHQWNSTLVSWNCITDQHHFPCTALQPTKTLGTWNTDPQHSHYKHKQEGWWHFLLRKICCSMTTQKFIWSLALGETKKLPDPLCQQSGQFLCSHP